MDDFKNLEFLIIKKTRDNNVIKLKKCNKKIRQNNYEKSLKFMRKYNLYPEETIDEKNMKCNLKIYKNEILEKLNNIENRLYNYIDFQIEKSYNKLKIIEKTKNYKYSNIENCREILSYLQCSGFLGYEKLIVNSNFLKKEYLLNYDKIEQLIFKILEDFNIHIFENVFENEDNDIYNFKLKYDYDLMSI